MYHTLGNPHRNTCDVGISFTEVMGNYSSNMLHMHVSLNLEIVHDNCLAHLLHSEPLIAQYSRVTLASTSIGSLGWSSKPGARRLTLPLPRWKSWRKSCKYGTAGGTDPYAYACVIPSLEYHWIPLETLSRRASRLRSRGGKLVVTIYLAMRTLGKTHRVYRCTLLTLGYFQLVTPG